MVDLTDLYRSRFSGLERVLMDIVAERKAQDAEWGGPAHDDHHSLLQWAGLISQHLSRLEPDLVTPSATAPRDAVRAQYSRLRRRLLVIASLAVAAIESLDRQEVKRESLWATVDQALAATWGAPPWRRP